MARTSASRQYSRRDILKGAAVAGIGAVSGAMAHGYLYERHHIEVTRETLPVSGLPYGLAGLKVGYLSDLHHSETVPLAMIDRAVQLVMAESPDLIVLGGDYVTWGGGADRRYVRPVAESLARLSAPHGIFAVLGNHDDDDDMPKALSAQGIAVLRDARTRVAIRGEFLEIAGIRFWTRKASDIARVLKGAGPNIMLLAHTPKRLVEAAALAIPLVLSGHTHGGQIVLPAVGAIAAREFPVVAGKGQRDATTIFVSRGVGTVYIPVRFNCPPEVAILTLQPVTNN